MTVEAQSYGYSHWRLPSPSSTPKASDPSSPSLRTPRTACSPSFFADAFSTPRPNGQNTPAQTPVYGTFAVSESLNGTHRTPYARTEDAAFHNHRHTANSSLQLPPVSPARRLSSSPNPSSSSHPSAAPRLTDPLARPHDMNPFQMQTPPPTRDASSRGNLTYPRSAVANTPANTAPHPAHATPSQIGQMQPPPALNVQTPFQYNPLQFSPENFGFPGSGPASAPAYPQSRLFWDPSSNPQGLDVDLTAMHDPFAPQHQAPSPAPVWPSFQHQVQMEQQMSQQLSFGTPQSQPALHMSNNQTFWSPGDVLPRDSAPFTSPIRPATTSGVNPHGFATFSSPPQNTTGTIQPHQTQMSHGQGGRQPYEHQMQELKREQVNSRQSLSQHTRTSTASSTASNPATTRPGLQRSNTDSGTRRRPNQSTDSRLSAVSLEQHILRKPSPLKRHSQQSQTSLSAIPESDKPRSKTRLVIDENGTARTEIVPAQITVDSRRRSGMWEIDSDSDTEDEDIVPSQRSSFVFTGDAPRRTKQARIDSVAETSKVARSASSGSLSRLSLGVRRTASSSSRRGSNKIDPRRSSVASFDAPSFNTEGAERSWDMDGVEEGDAQLALKRVIEDKLKRQEKSPEEKLKAYNQRWSLASADIAKLQPFSFEAPTSTPTSHPSISPVAPSYNGAFATPSTDRASFPNDSIRCTCQHNQDDGTQMIQCESCQKWLHSHCVFHNQPVPQIYVCSFCTGFTPIARGGRIREPIRNAPQHNSFVSPLAGRGNNPFR